MNNYQLPVATNFAKAITCVNQPERRSIRTLFGSLLGAALLVTALTAGSMPAQAQFVDRTSLILQNGWTAAPFATSRPTVEVVSGIVQFKGAIGNGTSGVAFTLGAAFRPLTD